MPRYQQDVIKFDFLRGNILSGVKAMNLYLNERAEEGWRVVSITSVPVGGDDYTNSLIVVLERSNL